MSVVIPAYNAEATVGSVLRALSAQRPPVSEVVVVDDASTDRTAVLAESLGARVVRARKRSAGGARNVGWDAANGDVVVFLDADAVPAPGWSAGLSRALREFPGAIVGCARTFAPHTRWGWVAHLQVATPFLPRGVPRGVPFVSSFCMAVPRDVPLRFDETYGGEDGLFSAAALRAGYRLVFDPRFHALHAHTRESFAELRRQQRRMAYGFARVAPVHREGVTKRVLTRIPVHYFALVRLVFIFSRVKADRRLRSRFVHLLPWLVVAEWTYGFEALRYAVRRPALEGADTTSFR